MTGSHIPGAGRWLPAAVVVAVLVCAGGNAVEAAGEDRTVVVTTSLLECAVSDVAGDSVRVRRLIPPRACPGHFDASPADLEAIAQATAFIRHDYQEYLDRRMTQAGKKARQYIAVRTAGAQTIPANYVALCRDLCDALTACFPAEADTFRRRSAGIERTVKEAAEEARGILAGSAGGVVVAAQQQREFCEWAGLRVASVFGDADMSSLRGVEAAVASVRRAGAKAVVCNLQRGVREGEALAAKAGVPAVILTNFPVATEGGYRAMLLDNARAISAGLRRE